MAHHRDEGQMPANRYIPDNRGLGRPVDRSQERYEPSHLGPRRTLPHGDVTRDGAHAWPRPSMTSRVLVYGGAALAAAAVTAGTVLAVRKVADLVTGNDELDRDADRAAEQAEGIMPPIGVGRMGKADLLGPGLGDLRAQFGDVMRFVRTQREPHGAGVDHDETVAPERGVNGQRAQPLDLKRLVQLIGE